MYFMSANISTNNDLISILVPVYNIEKQLEKCLDTILNQTYKNFELIIVDDGSTDDSLVICRKYEKKDNRIKVIHKKNGGLSSARNEALKIAKGKYIGFVDSDDCISENMFEKLYTICTDNKADIAICDYATTEKDIGSGNKKIKLMNKQEFMPLILTDKITSHVWNKLFNRELFDKIQFPDNMIAEDIAVMHEVFFKAERIVHTAEKLYFYYCDNPVNISNHSQNNIRNPYHRGIHFENRFYFSRQYYPECSSELLKRTINFYKMSYIRMLNSKKEYSGEMNEISAFFKKNTKQISNNKLINKKNKILILLISFKLNCLIGKLYMVNNRLFVRMCG